VSSIVSCAQRIETGPQLMLSQDGHSALPP
jgi:hypothetical protein